MGPLELWCLWISRTTNFLQTISETVLTLEQCADLQTCEYGKYVAITRIPTPCYDTSADPENCEECGHKVSHEFHYRHRTTDVR